MTLIMTVEQANALLNYLARRPYGEVFELVAMIQSLPKKEAVDGV